MSGEHRMQWSTQPELIDQIIDGAKTATVTRLEWQDGYDEYSTALRVGEVYTSTTASAGRDAGCESPRSN